MVSLSHSLVGVSFVLVWKISDIDTASMSDVHVHLVPTPRLELSQSVAECSCKQGMNHPEVMMCGIPDPGILDPTILILHGILRIFDLAVLILCGILGILDLAVLIIDLAWDPGDLADLGS